MTKKASFFIEFLGATHRFWRTLNRPFKNRKGVVFVLRLLANRGSAKPLRTNKQQRPTPRMGRERSPSYSLRGNFADFGFENKKQKLKN
ncbi:MAG: hypothetical protein ACI38O_00765 [Fibrobacter intestinalis]|uniref:hypothetical protein n=2 Tax=Fibrobacter TaxID=832 RepID=UPI0023F1E4CF|nr:hypothetical protein [Fibrobacter intestinalis]